MVDWKNKEEYNQYQRDYYRKNIEKCRKYRNDYHRKHQIKRNQQRKNSYLKNKEKELKRFKEYRLNNPEKCKARNYAHTYHQIGDFCSICGEVEDLQFHHTDYINNEGITVCRQHHKAVHRN